MVQTSGIMIDSIVISVNWTLWDYCRGNITYVYWTVHHLDSRIKIDQLMSLAFFFAQHFSNVSTFIFRSLRLCLGVLLWFDVCWRYGVVSLCRLRHLVNMFRMLVHSKHVEQKQNKWHQLVYLYSTVNWILWDYCRGNITPCALVGEICHECGKSRVFFFRNVITLQLGCISFTFEKTACSPPRDSQEVQVEVTIPEASERTTAEE